MTRKNATQNEMFVLIFFWRSNREWYVCEKLNNWLTAIFPFHSLFVYMRLMETL